MVKAPSRHQPAQHPLTPEWPATRSPATQEALNAAMANTLTDVDRNVAQAARAMHEAYTVTPVRMAGMLPAALCAAAAPFLMGAVTAIVFDEEADQALAAEEADWTMAAEDIDQ
jgi:hypothetical protein